MTQQAPRPLLKAAGVITMALVLSRLLGYVREALMAARFGATHVTDAYVVAQDIPASLFAAVSVSLVMVFIPVYRETLERQGEEKARRLVSLVLNATLLLAVLLTGLGWILSPSLIPLLVPGLPDEIHALATELTRIMLPMMLFAGLGGVASAVLNTNRHFAAPAFGGLASNLVMVSTLLLVTTSTQIRWVALAFVGGMAAAALIQVPFLSRRHFRYELVLDLTDPLLQRIGRLILPVIVTTGATQLQNFVDRFMSSGLMAGSISSLNYAVRVNSLPYGIVGLAIATVLYPNLAEQAVLNRPDELRRTIAYGLRTLAWVLLPMALAMLVFGGPLVQIFFQRGAFDMQATASTVYALMFYAPGILFFGWLDFLNRCYFALQNSLTPMWIGVGMVALNAVLNFVLVGPLGIGGIALGTSISAAVAVGVLLWKLQGRTGKLGRSEVSLPVLMSLGTSLVGLFCGDLGYDYMQRRWPGTDFLHQSTHLAVSLLLVTMVHVGLGLLLGHRDGRELLVRIGRRLLRRKD